MKRTTTIELDDAERTVLALAKAAAIAEQAAHRARRRAVSDAVSMGLPCRLVGENALYSPAQVSRLTSGAA